MGSVKKGKATANIDFNPEDPPEAYSDPSIHSRVSEYMAMTRLVHGPQFDPSTQDLDGEIVTRVGGGKKYGRYWIGDSTIDTASTPTLPDLSKEHEREPGDTPTANHYTVPDGGSPGYFLFIHRSLIVTYFCFAL